MNSVHLRRLELARNMRRFYRLDVVTRIDHTCRDRRTNAA